MTRAYRCRGHEYIVSSIANDDGVRVVIDDVAHDVRVLRHDRDRLVFVLDGEVHDAVVRTVGSVVEIGYRGRRFVLEDPDADEGGGVTAADAGAADGLIRTPMPGKVVDIHVAVGDEVGAGARLLVLESMKMQNDVKAPYASTVRAVHATTGENVDFGDVLVELDPPDPTTE